MSSSQASWKKQSSRLQTGHMKTVNNDFLYSESASFNNLESINSHVNSFTSEKASIIDLSSNRGTFNDVSVNNLFITNLGQNIINYDRWIGLDLSKQLIFFDLSSAGNFTNYGGHSMMKNKKGWGSTAFGYDTMRNLSSNTDISFANTAVGTRAMRGSDSSDVDYVITGKYNSAFGYESLRSITSGNNNSAFGYQSLKNVTTGIHNTSVGGSSLLNNTTGNMNVAVGTLSLLTNTTGNWNTACGSSALNFNTTGSMNVAVGNECLINNKTGINNTAIGYNSMYKNVNGECNSALGTSSLYNNSGGNFNVAVGHMSLYSNTTGSNNVAIGTNTLYKGTTGANNTVVGCSSDIINVGGSGINIVGFNNTSAYSNVNILGANISATGENRTFIGNVYDSSRSDVSRNVVVYDPLTKEMTYDSAMIRKNGLNKIIIGDASLNNTYISGMLSISRDTKLSHKLDMQGDGNHYLQYKSNGSFEGPMLVGFGGGSLGRSDTVASGIDFKPTLTWYGNNVGIGTVSPGYTLDVTGTANFSGATTIGGTLGCTSINTNDGTIIAGSGAVNCGALGCTSINTNGVTAGTAIFSGATTIGGTLSCTSINTNGGTITAGTANFSGAVNCGAVNCGAVTCSTLRFTSLGTQITSNQLYVESDGTVYKGAVPSSTSYSSITQSGTYIGINTTPSYPLHVVGYAQTGSMSAYYFGTVKYFADIRLPGLEFIGEIETSTNEAIVYKPIVAPYNDMIFGVLYERYYYKVSIYSEFNIYTDSAFIVSSDKRIKTNIVDIDDSKALSILRKIQPKTYEYIDKFQKGNDSVIGFIAQEIKEIIPKAVIIVKSYIPNFYTFCEVSSTDTFNILLVTSPIDLSWNPLHDLSGNPFIDAEGNACSDASGNKVFKIKLYDQSDNEIECKTTNVLDKRSFLMDISGKDLSIDRSGSIVKDVCGNSFNPRNLYFLYGQEVDDFNAMDKNAIFTVVTAAVQDIDRIQQAHAGQIQSDAIKIEALENKITDLQNKYKILEDKVAMLISKM